MKFNKYLICALFLVLICCIGAASAAETGDDVVAANDTIDEAVSEAVDVSDEIDEEPLGVSEELALSDGETPSASEKVIYVGHNNVTEGGNGSIDNPFPTFKAACDNVKGEDNVNIKVFEGNYTLGSILEFNTSNLNIEGMGKVIIKNQYDDDPSTIMDGNGHCEAFALTSDSANFTFSNLIFDASDRLYSMSMYETVSFFAPFWGNANLGIYNNCTFLFGDKERYNRITGSEYNSIFRNCYIEVNNGWDEIFFNDFAENSIHKFEYCIFISDMPKIAGYVCLPANISMDSVWFGINEIPGYTLKQDTTPWSSGYTVSVSRYAIFNVFQNYLGNNQYEILGKLTWNGTEDQDGMENFQPMTVKLSSTTGDINETAVLTNGNFRAVYTSSNPNNKVTATLDEEEKELNFNTIDIILEPVSIYYGEDQNISVTFPQVINSTVTISINDKHYEVKVNESNSVIFTIKDMVLKAGDYIVNVTLNDEKAQLYGANSTTFTVSKVSNYAFSPDIPSEAKVGDSKTVTVELPSDATGNVIVTVNGKANFTKTASANVEITINGLVAGNNNITVTYSGDDKYVNKSVNGIIPAEKVPVNVTNNTIVIDSPVNSNTPSVSINLTSDATGNLTVTVNGKNYTQELVNGSAVVTITDLASGTYNAVVTYSGDGKYDPVTKNVTVTVNAIKTSIIAPSVTTTYNVAKELIVTLKDANGNALNGKKVTVNVGTISKTLTTDANGQVSVDISSLVPKTYTATIKFEADGKYAQSTATAKVVVNKAKSKINAKKATFKAKKKTKKYTITLKAGKKAISKVKVTLKVKGKTYKATTNAKGKATFKITKLTKKGKHNAVIKFKGNKYYKATSKKVKLTIKK